MQFCRAHWLQLHAEIGSRGLGQYVASNCDEAKRTVYGGGFEPVFSAATAIFETAYQRLDTQFDALEDACPVCWFAVNHRRACDIQGQCSFRPEALISMAAEQQLADAKRRGLVATA
jgi:hypothetical protein